jgi:3-hydroxybutyryl-CoA dehydrogenase
MQPQDVRTVGVVGAGTMGSGIIEICARVGLAVTFVEGSDELVEAGRGRIESSTTRAVDRGKLPAADRDALLARISGATDLSALADADVVIEAATEHRDAKLEIFRRVDELTRPDVVLGSNTSSIPIAELATLTKRPELVIGMHFFNPPPVMALLELTPSLVTSDETVAFARGFGERLGKSVVVAKDHAGFIVNRLLIPYLLSAIRMLDDGFATAEDIDAAITLGLAHPMGPLRLTDLIGLDTTLQVAEVLYEEFKEPLYAPPPRLRRMVEAGLLGRKSGQGFYDYSS